MHMVILVILGVCALGVLLGYLGYQLGKTENQTPVWRDKGAGIVEIDNKLYKATPIVDVKYNTTAKSKRKK